MTPLDYVPVAVQACFAWASLLKFRALWRVEGVAGQSVGGSALAVAAHSTMFVWALCYKHDSGMAAASVLGVAMTLPLLSLIVYRRWRATHDPCCGIRRYSVYSPHAPGCPRGTNRGPP